MSEDHVRLFASAVPGNGSSNIVGLNGGGRVTGQWADIIGEAGSEGSRADDPTQQTGYVGRYTPESPDDDNNGASPPAQIDNENGREHEHESRGGSPEDDSNPGGGNYIEREAIEQMDDIIESFTEQTHKIQGVLHDYLNP